jgi:hypothetical protein
MSGAQPAKTREAAISHLASIVAVFVNDRCIGKEGDAELAEFHADLRALGVTGAEIEEWA